MNARWWKLLDDGALKASTPEKAVEDRKHAQASYWVDIDSYEPAQLDRWLRDIQASGSVRECCSALGEMPRIVPLDDATFFEVPVYRVGPDPTALGVLCMDRLVVTMHRNPVPQLEEVPYRRVSASIGPMPTSALVASILLLLSGQSYRFAESLKKSVYALDERMDREADQVDDDEILSGKRSLRRLDMVVSEQSAIFALLSKVETPFLNLNDLPSLMEPVSRNIAFLDRTIDRLEAHLSDLQQRYDANRQDKMNQRLALLTVLSAIFLPLTLVTGIYGMNFDVMPELHLTFAYPLALGAMAAIAGGLYWYFRSRGWLD